MKNISPADILKDNSLLNDISVTSLDNWIKDYPYASLLHSIRIKKYFLDNHPDKETVLLNYSAHIPQRDILADFLKKEIQVKTALPEKKVIPKKIQKEEVPKKEVDSNIKETQQNKTAISTVTKTEKEKPKKRKTKITVKKDATVNNQKTETQNKSFQGWLKSLSEEKEIKKSIKKEKEKPDLSNFTITKPLPGLEEITKLGIESMKSKNKTKRSSAVNLDALANKSIKLLDDHITETYAGLLAKQNKIDKAIEAYHKLSLKFPEKSSYFAKIINDLKNK